MEVVVVHYQTLVIKRNTKLREMPRRYQTSYY